jgi:tetratricopeptide (TPR) repeat protein
MSIPPSTTSAGQAEEHFRQGNLLREAGRGEEAIAAFCAALALRPESAEVASNLGHLLEQAGRLEEALVYYRQAIAANPGLPEAQHNLGNALFKTHRLAEAVGAFRRALALRPEFASAWLNLGNALRLQNELTPAIEAYQRALALNPERADAHVNLANAFRAQNRLEEALASSHRALALAPQLPQAHLNAAMVHLVAGDLRAGWPHAEYRHALKLGGAGREFAQPQWRGAEPLAGRTILLHAEQGFGDTLHFVRYVRLVIALGAAVHVEVQPALKALLAASLPEAAGVLAHGDPLPSFDLHCPLPSLPLAFQTELASIPSKVPYVRVPAGRREQWRGYTGGGKALRIGLAWAGNPTHPNDFNRSLTLADLRGIFTQLPGAQFFCLKKELSAADAAVLAAAPEVTDPGPLLEDFADTAALLEQLDLVIAVDTSVAHLAGALGRPVWIMLPYSPDWRWLLGRTDSPWYPSAQLFRQPRTGDWAPVLEQVRRDLEKLCSECT